MPGYRSLNLEESATDGKYLKDIYQYFVDVDAKNSEQWWK